MTFTPIETERLILHHLRMEDAPSMFAYASDPDVAEYTLWDAHQSVEETQGYISQFIEDYATQPYIPLAMTLKEDPETVIGTIGLHIFRGNYKAELSYALSRKHWRQGITFEAAKALIEYGFSTRYLKRIQATCDLRNEASSSLIKKLEMPYEGCLRAYHYAQEKFHDADMYASVRGET